ncbi:hypothetical protein BHE74_00056525 [Ensete ventricosum]|nr:hypothetical protein BHE74_00056525 [Ensete ventricosum]
MMVPIKMLRLLQDGYICFFIRNSFCDISNRPVCRPPATRWYYGFSLVPSNTGLYRAVIVEISTITARYRWYRSVTIDFDRHRPLSGSISLATASCSEGRSKRKKEKKMENLRQYCPLTARRRLDYWRHLRPENLETPPRMSSHEVATSSPRSSPYRLLV